MFKFTWKKCRNKKKYFIGKIDIIRLYIYLFIDFLFLNKWIVDRSSKIFFQLSCFHILEICLKNDFLFNLKHVVNNTILLWIRFIFRFMNHNLSIYGTTFFMQYTVSYPLTQLSLTKTIDLFILIIFCWFDLICFAFFLFLF